MIKFNLESINPDDIEKTKLKVNQLKEQTSDIIKGVRTATFNLMPSELSDHGLVPALSKLTKELSRLTCKNILFLNKTKLFPLSQRKYLPRASRAAEKKKWRVSMGITIFKVPGL